MTERTISHYRVLETLGGGGMGVVYRAEDLHLGRPVALKFLPDHIARDEVARQRLLREARAAASLNHPHICTIYEIEVSGAQPFIAMELLEGQTLQQRIGGRPLPGGLAIDFGTQIADALAAAHAKGIIHRDLKPANLFVTAAGHVKILDFGLAKLIPAAAQGPASGDDLTVAAPRDLTEPGVAVGTVSYMSPEQALGEAVDERTDVYSLGVVLYEMATGAPPFSGPTAAAVFDSILHRAPIPPGRLNPEVPPGLESAITRALEKDPRLRYQTAADLRADLERLQRATQPRFAVAPSAAVVPDQQPAPGTVEGGRKRRQALVAGAILATVTALGAAAWSLARPAPALTESDLILLADWTNTTGDPVFDATLKQALAVKLEESPFLNVVPDQRVAATLRLMNRPVGERVAGSLAREVCERQGIKALLAGEIAPLGSQYVVTLQASNCQTGESIARDQRQAARKEAVLSVVGDAAVAIRRQLGESLSSIEMLNAPLEEATTGSLEALKAFAMGNAQRTKGAPIESIAFYRRAIELDPQFAMAFARLCVVYSNLTETALAKDHCTKAFALRERVSERERLYISGHYYRNGSGDVEKMRDTYEAGVRTYPRDYSHRNNLGLYHSETGDPERALSEFRQALVMAPTEYVPYINTAETYRVLGRYDEARVTLEQMIQRVGPNYRADVRLYEVGLATGNRDALERSAAKVKGTPGELQLLSLQARAAAAGGQLREHRRLVDQVVETSSGRGLREVAAADLAYSAACEAEFGYQKEARARATAALALMRSWASQVSSAIALARVKELGGAQALLRSLASQTGPRTPEQTLSLATVEASLALAQDDPKKAIALLEPLVRYDLIAGGPVAMNTRGLAYLANGQGRAALEAFAKLQRYRGLEPADLSHTSVYLGLARAHALSRDVAAARQAYEKFFELLKHADQGIPLLATARRESEALR